MEQRQFKVGDAVTVHDVSGPFKILKVARVLKHKTILEDHSQWKGVTSPACEYGAKFPRLHIALSEVQDKEHTRKRRLVRIAESITLEEWKEFPLDLLSQVFGTVREIREKKS